MFRLLLILVIITTMSANVFAHTNNKPNNNEIAVTDLGNGEVKSVRVEGCRKNQSPCFLRAGVAYDFTVEFVANQNTENATVIPRFLVGDQLIPLNDEITSGDGCIGMSPPCPLRRGRTYQSNGLFQLRCFPTETYLSNAIRNNMQNVTTVGLYTGVRGILLQAVFKFTATDCNV